MTSEKPRFGRMRFSLATLFIVVTIAAVVAAGAAWVFQQRNWMRARTAFIDDGDGGGWAFPDGKYEPSAPGALWLFGERGHPLIMVTSTDDLDEAKRLFPEAHLGVNPKLKELYRLEVEGIERLRKSGSFNYPGR